MSAFVVDAGHIDAILTFAIAERVSLYLPNTGRQVTIDRDTADEIGRELLTENVNSVVSAYKSDDWDDAFASAAAYTYKPATEAHTPLTIIKACNCLDYQSCEHDGWMTSLAWHILTAIRDRACTKLPGYDHAPGWGLSRAA